MRRFFSGCSLGLGLIYVLPLAAYVLLRSVPSDAPWWLELTNTSALYLFVPAAPVFLIGLLSSWRPAMLLSFIPIALFLFLYGGLFLPGLPAAEAGGVVVKVMTHNVDAGRSDAQGVVEAITTADPDVVALQELTVRAAELFMARLGDSYPYRALLPRTDYSGVGLFSRFPIEFEESFTLGHKAQHLILNVQGQSVHVFNFHPYAPLANWARVRSFPLPVIRGFDTSQQSEQVADLMEKVEAARGPIVLLGDLNLTDQSRQYSRITERLIDAYRESGWGFGHTFPANRRLPRLRLALPLLRIDYVFHSGELKALEAHVGEDTGSDHLPVVATLRLNR